MALKYFLDYKSSSQDSFRIEVYSPTHTGEPIQLVGSAPDTLSINWGDNTSDDPHSEHLLASTATFRVYNDLVDVEELQNILNDEYKVKIYKNGAIFWNGYLLSDGIQKQRGGVRYVITLSATDGVKQLDGLVYKRTLLEELDPKYITVNGVKCAKRAPLNIIRQILFSERFLNNPLPIRWMCNNKSDQYPNSDALAGLNEVDPYGELELQEKDCYWWLNSLIKSQYCWMRQYKGYWYIINYLDLKASNGVFTGYEIPALLSDVTATAITIDMSEMLYTTIAGDGFNMLKKAYSTVNAIYDDTTNKNNVVPNGSFDQLKNGVPLYWKSLKGDARISSSRPLNSEYEGNSISVSNFTANNDWITFGQIPLDTTVLFKNATLGFIFNPESGYSVNGDGVLNRNQVVARIKFTGYKDGQLSNLYLNENGYWQGFGIINGGLNIINTINYGDYVDVVLGGDSAKLGQNFNINYLYGNPIEPEFSFLGSYTFTSDTDFNNALTLIADNTSGNVVNLNTIRYYDSNILNPNAYITGGEDTPTDINFIFQDGIKQGDIVTVQFQSKGLAGDIKLPNAGNLIEAIGAGAGLLSIEFYSKAGTTFRLDDFYFNVRDNHDVYTISNGGKGASVDYNLEVSSSFSGHMISSYMNKYDTASRSMLWDAGGKKGTLTELYGINALNWLNRSSSIFQGSFPKEVNGWFLHLDGKDYIPLTETLDCHTMTSNFILFEAKTVHDEYTITHKSSEDNKK